MDASIALKTYRFLRMAMIVLVLMLFSSVIIEIIAAGGCLRTSISSYWHTPARGVFVGALVAIGACLIILKGNTEVEDVLLNVAGLFAAVVAFVPIADPRECVSVSMATVDTRADVFNNVTALSVAGVAAMAVTLIIARRESPGGLPLRVIVGIGVSLFLGGVLLAGFLWARDLFDRWAHYVAAAPLFIILLAVMVLNAFSFGRATAHERHRAVRPRDYANRYSAIAVITLVLTVGLIIIKLVTHWAHGVFWIEVVVIVAFAIFWVVQSVELWNAASGLRPDPQGVAGPKGD